MMMLESARWIFLLCASVGLASASGAIPRDAWAMGGTFVLVCAVALKWPPPVSGACLAVAALAAWHLLRRPAPLLPVVGAGVTAGLAAGSQVATGAPVVLAVLLAGLPCAIAWRIARRRHTFAPQKLLDDAFCCLVIAGPVMAAAPTLLEGWRAALALNAQKGALVATTSPTWIWIAVLGAVSFGIFHGWWLRR